MANDGGSDYSTYSGAQLLEAFDVIDHVRFPKNYEALRAELARRPVPGPSLISGGEVVELTALSSADKKSLVRSCVAKVIFIYIWAAIGGALLGGLAAILLSIVVSVFGESWALWFTFLLVVAGVITLHIGTYWAYTKCLLQEPIGNYTFRLIRLRAHDT